MAAASTVRTDGPPVTGHCDHAWDFSRYYRGPRTDSLDCQSPLDGRCFLCGARSLIPCRSHRSSRCRPCAVVYARRVRQVAHSGVRSRRPGFTYLATFTAPSEVGSHCKVRGCQARDGACTHEQCRCSPVGGVDLPRWNATAGARWNRTRTALRRLSPHLEFFRAVEVQEGAHRADGDGRGALHLHVMLWSPVPLSKRELRRLAVDHGWGHSVDLQPCQPGSARAAYYVAKYVSKACDARGEVPWLRVRRRDASYETAPPRPAVDPVQLRAVQALGDLATDDVWDEMLALVQPEPRFWHPVTPVQYDEDGRYFVQVLDDGDNWLAWTPVRVETVATHRNWSMSQGWGLSMAAVVDEARAYAVSKAQEGSELGSAGASEVPCEAPASRAGPLLPG